MKQLVQDFNSGELKIEEVPVSALRNGFVKVKNTFSLISAGTEKTTVDIGKASLLGKAKKRPDLVQQVLQNIRQEGLLATAQKVKTKLNTPKALGYSCCGVVIESKDFDGKFKPQDRVACAGQDYASHAEIVCVPQNLIVKIPDNVTFQEAVFTTIGSIAMQGVRQADPRIGENICVIGLGLIGQITAQILTANGCRVSGIDVSEFALRIARKLNIDFCANRRDENLFKALDNFTSGAGFDKVIITASSSDNDPIVLATEILRKKGVIIVVGNVKMDIPREPFFYKKELEIKIATSYGPGRYDPIYEEIGIDYPLAYVRFTENRNMETFLELVSKKLIKLEPLATHTFDFENAIDAYDLILGKKAENFIGVLLKYANNDDAKFVSEVELNSRPVKKINVGFIGAGSFAQSYLLPNLKNLDVSFDTVVTTKGITAKNAAGKFKFNRASCKPEDIMQNERINTVFIATQHDTHAELICQTIKNKKHAFVEKPLALNIEELKQVVSLYKGNNILMVGYNRRFADVSKKIRQGIKAIKAPVVMNFRINAGYIPQEHWTQNPDIGGGRIVGEACHFIDLMQYLSGAKPEKVYASCLNNAGGKWQGSDNVSINIKFDDGSIGNIVYTAMGDKAMEKERLEIFASGNSYVINDFKEGVIYINNRAVRLTNRGKGHTQELAEFINAVKMGKENPVSFESLVLTTLATFKIIESLKTGLPEKVDINELY